ncbi:MAG: S-layer homology domain-containing protein [Oscillospiraceae bacterium]|jgi:N-acetylmuramoyl-L-alanine amidase|nr:S-layer homology domain-containing protein [Oscillospiraceae bacterium]
MKKLTQKIISAFLLSALLLSLAPALPASAKAPLQATGNPLAGVKIGIDAGHQGKGNYGKEPNAPGSSVMKTKVSSGTQGRFTRVPEYEVNLAVALLLEEKLTALGAEVVMTRRTNDIDITNVERTLLINDAGVDLSIKIHADGSENPDVNGAWMLIPTNSITADINEQSKAAAEIILAEFVAETGAKNRGLQPRTDITGFNWSTVPVVLIEMGYMTNETEDRLLATDEYREKCAQGLANGVLAWVGPQIIEDPIDAFSDVSASAWFAPYIIWAAETAVVTGFPDGTFHPNSTMTRAEFVQVLHSLAGKPSVGKKTDFADVQDSDWFASAVYWAAENSVTAGTGDGRFNPAGAVTREEAVTFLLRFAKLKGDNRDFSATQLNFSDTDSISPWAYIAVQWGVGSGVVGGYPDGTFLPQRTATRAEVVTILHGYVN